MDPLLDALRQLTGNPAATFRAGQREAVEALVEQRRRVLVVQRTGWGKSAVYFLSTHLLRQRGAGPTLLISPLLALMRNQIEAAERLGLRSMTVNSATNTTVGELQHALHDDAVDLILVSPERLANPEFAAKIMPIVGKRPGLIVIDEVHCISDWGHDFRPDYRRIGRIIDDLTGTDVPILGCTATANDRVVADVAAQLGAEMTTFRGPLRRDGLALSALALDRPAERLAWLAETIPELPGSGIVYCLTVRDVQIVADWLRSRGVDAEGYWGGLDGDDRLTAERRLQTNDLKVLVATTALGMGYDKPDLSFVVHYQSPGSPVAYYQQVGRAGRQIDTSVGVLLRGLEDAQIQDHFIDTAFASKEVVLDVLREFANADQPLSLMRVQSQVNIGWTRLGLVVKQLDVDGALERVTGQTYRRTDAEYDYPEERVRSVTMARRHEQQTMLDYFHTAGCRMTFLSDLLDDDATEPCGACDNCAGTTVARPLPADLIAAAEAFLRGRPIEIVCRKQRVGADDKRHNIPAGLRPEDGRALALWGDAGWGAEVRAGQRVGVFDKGLIDAFAETLRDWRPTPAPVAVVPIPSARHPGLIERLAAGVAERLGLDTVVCVERVAERRPQGEWRNAAHQQRNVEGAFAVRGPVPGGPVLLVDDVVDSTWTVVEVAGLLRRAGVPTVHPAALASLIAR